MAAQKVLTCWVWGAPKRWHREVGMYLRTTELSEMTIKKA